MSKVLVEVEVGQLRLGHYVARLDRPWTDTPFLFQGFVLEDEDQLLTLRQLCRRVFIEVSRAEEAELRRTRRVAVGAPTADASRLQKLERDPAALLHEVPAKDRVSLATELPQANAAYREAKRTVAHLFDTLRRGGGLDVPQLQVVADSMVDSVLRNRDAISWLARMKSTDEYLYGHSLSTSIWALAFGRHLGLDKSSLCALGTGAMLLDIGKTQLPAELLRKSAEPSDAEWRLLQEHVQRGVDLLSAQGGVDPRAVTMVATHHERLDGSGYPTGASGDGIALLGRIAGIIDCYDAMISDRPYARRRSPYEAVRELKALGGTKFPANLVELFIQAVGVFPTGTLVELNTGEVGIVIGQNRFRRLRPEVMLVLDAGKRLRTEFTVIDLLTCESNLGSREPALWIARGLEGGAYGIDPADYFT